MVEPDGTAVVQSHVVHVVVRKLSPITLAQLIAERRHRHMGERTHTQCGPGWHERRHERFGSCGIGNSRHLHARRVCGGRQAMPWQLRPRQTTHCWFRAWHCAAQLRSVDLEKRQARWRCGLGRCERCCRQCDPRRTRCLAPEVPSKPSHPGPQHQAPPNKKPASRRVVLNALIPLGNLVAMGGLEPHYEGVESQIS